MRMHSNKFNFLTDEEALSFIAIIIHELRELAENRVFRPFVLSLTGAERTSKAMKHDAVKAD